MVHKYFTEKQIKKIFGRILIILYHNSPPRFVSIERNRKLLHNNFIELKVTIFFCNTSPQIKVKQNLKIEILHDKKQKKKV